MELEKLNRGRWTGFVMPLIMTLLATVLARLMVPVFPVANMAMLYLAAVLVTAVTTHTRPALAAAILGFAAYNFFLTEPYYSLQMLHREDVLTAVMLVLVALITGPLAARLSEQVRALRASESWSARQMEYARRLSGSVDGQSVVMLLAEALSNVLGWHTRREPDVDPTYTADIEKADINIHEDEAGVTLTFHDARGMMVDSLRVSAREPVGQWHRERIEALTGLARLAWERVQLVDKLRQETLSREREELRSALLSSVSHDLRTPLSTMIGSVSSLLDLADSLDEKQRNELLTNTLREAQRLDRYIQKLLDMTRLGHGELTLDRDWIGLDDIVSVVLRRCRSLSDTIEIRVEVPDDLPLLHVHPALIEQALFNIVENAIRFTPADGTIWIRAEQDEHWLYLDVRDSGPGIAPDEHEKVFDMFHTVSHGDQYPAGTGLGLTICRSIVVAHGGEVSVLPSRPHQGATIRMTLPLPASEHSSSTRET